MEQENKIAIDAFIKNLVRHSAMAVLSNDDKIFACVAIKENADEFLTAMCTAIQEEEDGEECTITNITEQRAYGYSLELTASIKEDEDQDERKYTVSYATLY